MSETGELDKDISHFTTSQSEPRCFQMTTLVMLGDKEKQIQATGGQYCYQHAETERNNTGCFREHEKKMEK